MSDSPSPRAPSNAPLIISLCVNLLLAGLIVIPLVRFAFLGPMFRPPMSDPLGPGMERGQMHQMLSPRMMIHAAPEKADKIKAVIDGHRGRIDELRGQSMAARRKVMDVFGAAKFDSAAFDKALTDLQAADAAFEKEILKVVSETAGTLTPEERQKAAQWHDRPMMFRGGWPRDHEMGDGPPPPPLGGPGELPPGGPPPQ